ncbi:MAG: hypothetical protein K2L45_02700 [Muribaculaceae bacterium]|nr:hypothetical protein [Muribaculaceae bacterium]
MNLKYFLACSVVCVAVTTIKAAESTDWGELQPDVVYNYDSMTPVMGTFTSDASGSIRCYSSGSEISPYMEAGHENPINSVNDYYGANGEKVRVYQVEQGQTLYFYNGLPLDGGTFRIVTGNESIELVDAFPAAGDQPMSLSANYNATLSFSVPVKCTKCILAVNDANVELTPTISNSYITVNWFNTIRQWYREGKINEGDVMTLTITGIRDAADSSNRPNFGDGAGKLVLNYKMAGKPAELVWESGTPTSGVSDFLTYYLPGASEGIVSLTFSENLDPNCHPTAEITYGDRDNIELGMYIEYPPVSVEGKTVSVNLQGVSRFPEEMVPGLPVQQFIELRITGIKSADGQYVLTGYAASPYSFGYAYNLKSVVYSIGADWVPVAGSSLKSGDEMEIWVLNGNKILFDSVDFSFVKDGATAVASVPYSELRVEKDAYYDDALLFYLAAPAIDADPDSEITVSFGGLKCSDGLDHSSDIFVRYKADTSAVEAIQVADGDNIFYDLTGRPVKSPSKGIYICNGKKIVVH